MSATTAAAERPIPGQDREFRAGQPLFQRGHPERLGLKSHDETIGDEFIPQDGAGGEVEPRCQALLSSFTLHV